MINPNKFLDELVAAMMERHKKELDALRAAVLTDTLGMVRVTYDEEQMRLEKLELLGPEK